MEKEVIGMLLSWLTICSIFLMLLFLLIRIIYAAKYERRIKGFALDTKDNDELSIADAFLNICFKIIKGISKLLNKSDVCKRYAKRLEKYLIYGDSSFKSIDYISLKFLAMIGVQILYIISLVIKIASFKMPVFLIGSLISFFSIDFVIIFLYKDHKSILESQLLQAIVMMNSAFKSGKNILQAISIVKKELPSPIKDEFAIIYTDLSYGLDIATVFERFYNRVKIEEAKYITSSLALLSKTGGNIVTVFNMIEKNFYDRLKIKNELSALTSSSKFLYRMLLGLPIIFALVIIAMNPSYFNPLISTKLGYIIDIIIVTLYIVYIIIVKNIMRVEEV